MALMLSTRTEEQRNIKKFVVEKLQHHFNIKQVNLKDRVRIVADIEKWKPEVEEIWVQPKTNVYEYSLYFDDEFVCRANSKTNPYQLEVDFLKGFLELYEHDKIKIDPSQYKEEAELVQQVKHDKKETHKKKVEEIDKLNEPTEVKATLKELEKDRFKEEKVSDQDIKKLTD